jgi:hypothetical protein
VAGDIDPILDDFLGSPNLLLSLIDNLAELQIVLTGRGFSLAARLFLPGT